MIDLLLNTGVRNTTFWVVLATLGLVLGLWWRARARRPEPGATGRSVGRLFGSSLVLAVVAIGTALNTGYGLYKGYVVPRDVMQDITSAQEFLQGRSLYPPHMTALIQAAVEREPPALSLLAWWPGLREKETAARKEAAGSHWVQAHPPLMSVLVAPLVACVGISGTYFAMCLLSLGGLLLTLVLLKRGLAFELTGRQAAVLGLLVLGWAPVIAALRNGQTGILLGALLVLGWVGLRRGRPALAGMAVAAATCLKLYPGLLLVYLLVRHPRAFAAALVTLLVLLAVPGALAGWPTYLEWFHTSRFVVGRYADYPTNLSLLGLLARSLPPGESGGALARALFAGLGMVSVGSLTWLVWRRSAIGVGKTPRLDLEYALFVALMPLLSPVAWDHYLAILLLPLAILGRRALTAATGEGPWLTFLGLLVLLSISEATYTWLFPGALHRLGRLGCNWLLLALPTLALAALCLWLAGFVLRDKNADRARHPDATGFSLEGTGEWTVLRKAVADVDCSVPGSPSKK